MCWLVPVSYTHLDVYKRQDLHAARPLQPLLPSEQMAVVAFAERAGQLTPERRIELANIASVATGATGAAGVQRLLWISNWLLGKR